MSTLAELCSDLLLDPLPPARKRNPAVPHAPVRNHRLNPTEQKLAVRNALRYFPPATHVQLAKEFADELRDYGHIYMYRFMPTISMKAYPISEYPSRTKTAAAIMHMIMNNLDPRVAQFPEELVTYGGNGQVFSNWVQFRLVMHYLAEMTDEQTLAMYSGHPLGLFPSTRSGPRVVITNGMVIPNYSSREHYDKMFALGVTMYGQMTAGSYVYIGPQGIVHGTTLTVLNAGRKYLGLNDLSGKVFLTSGLGGMSGAQAKAATISGCIGIVAEVSYDAIKKRYDQGWVLEMIDDVDRLVERVKTARLNKEVTSIGFHGNVVLVWERLAEEYDKTGELLVELGSDQTSCHDPYSGGYYPVGLSYQESQDLLASDPQLFRQRVQDSLRRQIKAINALADRGMFFWDYGNAFLLEAQRCGADVTAGDDPTGLKFRYPSYVQDIMGDIFSLGFGPFRWICTSGLEQDLEVTDRIAQEVLESIVQEGLPDNIAVQYQDNIKWIKEAGRNRLVVGSQARILYADQRARVTIALAFNQAIQEGKVSDYIVLSRDHHDVSGTDSPFRETSNIYDGSAFTADMAVQNCIGDSFRGATWVSLHNGGGVGWGEVMNGGFGLVLDGSDEAHERAKNMLNWDVSNGVARRSWSGNANAIQAIQRAMAADPRLKVTLPNPVDETTF
ncbi:urocanate hydratase-like [Daphnia pulicaria]|uniref:urocanate hydratase-like n=1 Tax=Daphnia pulicaria TaxID=35523 RepID=UPI001EEC0242|nr:urocanate hydratase-like [Daphnia pulicaria]